MGGEGSYLLTEQLCQFLNRGDVHVSIQQRTTEVKEVVTDQATHPLSGRIAM